MTSERLRGGWRSILALYAASFALPVGDTPGAALFATGALTILWAPPYFALWMANPLLWFGLAALARGRFGWATALGVPAAVAAALSSLLFRGPDRAWETVWFVERLGYIAWLGSALALAGVGLVGWWRASQRRRPQFRLRSLMLLVLAAALASTALLRLSR